ncbi:MAG: NusG domain II-containing protein [Oscillospiraceae bacterium]|nr:NusG domain II-containing protein [Oscillospiraceae bacterium]
MAHTALEKTAWGDRLIIAAVLISALCVSILFFPHGKSVHVAKLTVMGQETTLSLKGLAGEHSSKTVKCANGISLTLEFEAGRVRVANANCPDRLCVKTGWLDGPWKCAVCIPGQAILQINGTFSRLDAITG